MILVVVNFTSAGVQETFQKLLSLAVGLQLVPFLYLFGALLKISPDASFQKGQYGRRTLIFAGASGLVTPSLGLALAFFPAAQLTSLLSCDALMFGGTLLF